jgi:lipoate-protein ligase A
VVVRRPDDRVLVLGSRQGARVADLASCRRHQVAVARRRSGGGAVLVCPKDTVWLDVWIPRADPLFDDDVARAAFFVGEWWARALKEAAGVDAAVHTGGMVGGPGCDLCCFAGLGPGEVTVAGRKVVGVAQWRSRQGALFHCAAYRQWRPAQLAALLSLPHGRRPALVAAWGRAASGVGVERGPLTEALLATLPGEGFEVAHDGLSLVGTTTL